MSFACSRTELAHNFKRTLFARTKTRRGQICPLGNPSSLSAARQGVLRHGEKGEPKGLQGWVCGAWEEVLPWEAHLSVSSFLQGNPSWQSAKLAASLAWGEGWWELVRILCQNARVLTEFEVSGWAGGQKVRLGKGWSGRKRPPGVIWVSGPQSTSFTNTWAGTARRSEGSCS